MRQWHAFFSSVLLPVALIAFLATSALGQTINVKVRLNTATCLDTLRPTGSVQILGESKQATAPALTWTVGSGVQMSNIGGDYWEGTFQATPGDTIRFKFWTGFTPTSGTSHWSGWDGNINAGIPSGNNRILIVGPADTTLPLQYYNGGDATVAQYWRPFQSKPDSIAVYFRVNMGGVIFNPASQRVDARGGAPMGTESPWSTIVTLTQEAASVNAGSFWSGVAYVHQDSFTVGVTQQSFKFVIQSPETWESTSNRSFTFRGKADTTIFWYYFNNAPPSGPVVNAYVLFLLKLDALEKSGLFNRALGDKVAVTGAKGWPPTGFTFDTEPTMLKMTYDATNKEWQLIESFSLFPNTVFPYKYYINWDTSRVNPASPNYIPGLTLTDGWEEPGTTGGADRRYTYTSQSLQTVPGDFGAEQQYFNSIHWKGAITKPIQVTFNINMNPATVVATNPLSALFRPGIDTAYIQFDGSLMPITQGFTMWGTDNRLMLSDPDGNGVYSVTSNLVAPTLYQACFRIVYTSSSGEVWNGSGSAIRGRRYYQYVHPTAVYADSAAWPATYSFAVLDWMNDSLTIEDPPNLNVITDVEAQSALPATYALEQNYPNPFNPSTVLTYSLPEKAHVRIEVFNLLGERVASLFDQEQFAGVHSVVWNARGVGSGIYFAKMQAGSFTEVRKMVLLR